MRHPSLYRPWRPPTEPGTVTLGFPDRTFPRHVVRRDVRVLLGRLGLLLRVAAPVPSANVARLGVADAVFLRDSPT